MIEEPLIFLGILFISLIISSLLLNDRAGVLKPIATRLFFIGVVFHELAHYIMSIVMGRVPKSINIYWRDERYPQYPNPRGSVKHKECPSFLQSIVISFAPLYLSTWLIFFLLFGVIFTPFYDPLIKTVATFVLLSLFLTAAPSKWDLLAVISSFKQDPKHSWYQVLLISLSIMILWMILVFTEIIFFLDVFYYLAIAGIYLMLKFTFIGMRKLVVRIDSYNYRKPQKISSRKLTRKRYRPSKPWREEKL